MTFSEQFPIVVNALNGGFLQTLKLFFGTDHLFRINVPV